MTDSEPDAADEEEAQPELCDWCGAMVSDGSEWYALVPDSSSIHAIDVKFDGMRMVVGCTKEHLAKLVEQYKHRPFVNAELWPGRSPGLCRSTRDEVDDRRPLPRILECFRRNRSPQD